MRDLGPSIVAPGARPRLALACLGLAVVLSVPLTGQAQTDQPAGGTATTSTRAGNIYDHKAHQPGEAEVCTGKGATVACPSASDKQQVEREVQELLQRSDPAVREKQRDLNSPR